MPIVRFPKDLGVEGDFAAGLDWHDDQSSAALAKWSPTKKEKYYVALSSRSGGAQYGTTNDSRTKGLPSAAAILASLHPGRTFFAVLPLSVAAGTDELFWMVGVEDGQVMPATDVVGTQNKILQELESILDLYGVNYDIYAPGYETLFEANKSDPDFFFGDRFDTKRFIVKKFGGLGVIFAVASIIVLVFAGNWGYEAYKAAKLREALEAAKAREAAMQAKISREDLLKQLAKLEIDVLRKKMAQFDLPSIASFAVTALEESPLYYKGWSFRTVNFDLSGSGKAGYIDIQLERINGYVSDLKNGERYKDWALRFEREGRTGYLRHTMPLEGLKEVPLSDELLFPELSDEDFELTDFAQRSNIDFKVGKPTFLKLPPEAAKLAGQLKVEETVAGLLVNKITFSGESLHSLRYLIAYIKENQFNYELDKGEIEYKYPHTWQMKVIRYGKR